MVLSHLPSQPHLSVQAPIWICPALEHCHFTPFRGILTFCTSLSANQYFNRHQRDWQKDAEYLPTNLMEMMIHK